MKLLIRLKYIKTKIAKGLQALAVYVCGWSAKIRGREKEEPSVQVIKSRGMERER
jgi:hypothetical protein